jgi:hypothetical protein
MKDELVVEIGGYWTGERSKTSQSPRQLFLPCACDVAPCRVGLCSMTPLVLRFITRSSWFNNSSGSSKRKWTFSYPKVKGDTLHQARTSKPNWILACSKMIFSRTLGQEGYTSARLRSWPHGLRVDRRYVGYSLEISDTRAPIEQNGRRLQNHHGMTWW